MLLRINGIILIATMIISLGDGEQLKAKERKNQLVLGVSLYRYSVLQQDNIFPDGYYNASGTFTPTPGASDKSSDMTFGIKFGLAISATSWFDIAWEGEFEAGTLDRQHTAFDAPSTVLGGQSFFGIRVPFGTERLSLHTMIGINYLNIWGEEAFTYSGSVNIQWYGTSGQAVLWAKNINAYRNNGRLLIPELDGRSRVAPAANIGLSGDILKSMRISFDYIPVYDDELRHDFRVGLALVFWVD